MKCFYHHEVDAVGLCKSCSKGICPDCATDVGGGLACAASCTEAVKSLNAVIKANTGAVSLNRKAMFFWPMFLIVLGTMFIVAPLLSGKPLQSFSSIMGGAFMFFGILLGVYMRAYQKALKS